MYGVQTQRFSSVPVRTLSAFEGCGFVVAPPGAVILERLEGQTGVYRGTKGQSVLKPSTKKVWLLKILKYN